MTFFSVVTHLMHHETYLYLEDAKRVAKPGGHIVMSFLALTNPAHWLTFQRTLDSRRRNNRAHLNAFIEPEVFRMWAGRLQLELVAVHNGGTPWVPLTEPVTMDDGRVVDDIADLGQSVAILEEAALMSAALSMDFLPQLASIVGGKNVLTSDADTAPYLTSSGAAIITGARRQW